MLRRSVSFAALFILVLAAASAPAGLAITKEFNQTYPLQPGGSFELQNVNGTVDVQGWDRDTIEIHAVKTAKHKESDLDLVSIDVDAKPSVVSVATRYPQNEGVEVAVEYTVHVPHCAHVEHLGTVNGTLRVSGIERVEDLRTVNGNIEVFEAGGSVHARTTNGNVHLELLHVQNKDGAIAETTGARETGPRRRANPAAHGERRDSIGGVAVDGLARRASKEARSHQGKEENHDDEEKYFVGQRGHWGSRCRIACAAEPIGSSSRAGKYFTGSEGGAPSESA